MRGRMIVATLGATALGRGLAKILALLLVMGASAVATLAAEPTPPVLAPVEISKVEAELLRLESSAGRKYTMIRYPLPKPGSVPHILAIDKDDYVWFSESGGRFAQHFIDRPPANRVGRLDQDGTISEWRLGAGDTSPMGIVFDAEGNLWITERLADRITRMGRDGSTLRFDIPTKDSWPTGIAIDSKGRVWFTETKGNNLGVLDPTTGVIVEYPFPLPKTRATGIAVDHDDKIWIAERDVNIIGRFDPDTAEFQQFTLPTPNSKPCAVAVDGKGQIWFSERNGGKIGIIHSNGTIQEFPLADCFAGPFLLVPDKQGAIWFSQIFSNRIGRFDPSSRQFEHFDIPGGRINPAGVALDSKGNVWFAEQYSNRVGLLVRTDLAYIGDSVVGDKDRPILADQDSYSFDQFAIPTPQSIPGIVEVDGNDTVWFTEMGGGFIGPGFPPGAPGGKIGFIRDGVPGELPTPTPSSGPTSLGLDPTNGDLWVSLRAVNKIARIRDSRIEEFYIPVPDSFPIGVSLDDSGNVWVALSKTSQIARFSPDGAWRFIDLPERDANPRTVFVDRNNVPWFSEKNGNHIGRIDTESWTYKRWRIPTRLAWPLSIIDDERGNIWFAQMRSDKLAKFDPRSERITEYKLPLQSAPFKIIHDPENQAIWISTVFANAVLRFDIASAKVVAAYRIPNDGVWVGGIARDSAHCFWVTEQFGNRVDRLCIDGVAKFGAKFGEPAGASPAASQSATVNRQ